MKNWVHILYHETCKGKNNVYSIFFFNPEPMVLRSTFINSLNYQNIAVTSLTRTHNKQYLLWLI